MRAEASTILTLALWHEKYTSDHFLNCLIRILTGLFSFRQYILYNRAQRQDNSKLKPLRKQSVEVYIECELLTGLQMCKNIQGKENKNIYLPVGEMGTGKKGVYGRRRVFSLSNFKCAPYNLITYIINNSFKKLITYNHLG